MPNQHTPPQRRPLKENQRPLWIIIFAILMASIAIRAKGQGTAHDHEFTTIQISDDVHVVRRASAR